MKKNFWLKILGGLFFVLGMWHMSYAAKEAQVSSEPTILFKKWYQTALKEQVTAPEDAALATVDQQGLPAIRVVSIRDVSDQGFLFFTQPSSPKVKHFHNGVSLVFYWPINAPKDYRQIIVKGTIEKSKLYYQHQLGDKTIEWQGYLIKPNYIQFGQADNSKKIGVMDYVGYKRQGNQWVKKIVHYYIPQFTDQNNNICFNSLNCLPNT